MYRSSRRVLGRVVHGLLVLAPLALGSVYGVWLAGRLGNTTSVTMGGLGSSLTGVVTLAIAAMAFFIALPPGRGDIRSRQRALDGQCRRANHGHHRWP